MGIIDDLRSKKKSISVTGLGYVGLPLAIAFSKYFNVIAFDTNLKKIRKLNNGLLPDYCDDIDTNLNMITFTSRDIDLTKAHFHVVAVPTDIDPNKRPDLSPLKKATQSIAVNLKPGDFVVYENTVYPGCTEEVCLPLLEKYSRLECFHKDSTSGDVFHLGYSPERIVPGDKGRTVDKINKLVGANTATSLFEISSVYNEIVEGELYETSIKVAETAKMIENVQRDLNISLINELAVICHKLNIDTTEVLKAAETKWNFHSYRPGLVGGHCIRVDPYYLIHKCAQLGYHPKVVAAGRMVNEYLPEFIAKEIVAKLTMLGRNISDVNILVMGVTYKENISDIRNSAVVDLILELQKYHLSVDPIDPLASPDEFNEMYSLQLSSKTNRKYDLVVLAVAHEEYKKWRKEDFEDVSKRETILFDLKGLKNSDICKHYWRL